MKIVTMYFRLVPIPLIFGVTISKPSIENRCWEKACKKYGKRDEHGAQMVAKIDGKSTKYVKKETKKNLN